MKALSLTQPWATLVAIGAKKVETRSWRTDYRGPLVIHAAKAMPADARRLVFEVPFREALGRAGIRVGDPLPRGACIAVANLVDVRSTNDAWSVAAQTDEEQAFGDYSPDRFMWFFEGVALLREPVPARGSLGLWDWTEKEESGDR